MSGAAGPVPGGRAPGRTAQADGLVVRPANEVPWAVYRAVFGRTYPSRCLCQRFVLRDSEFARVDPAELEDLARTRTACGDASAPSTSGLVAVRGEEPVGWVAVEPRTAYPRLRGMQVPWAGRDEDPDDAGVWAVTCSLVPSRHRHQGVGTALARAAVEHARLRGAHAVEGYPMLRRSDRDITFDEIRVGTVSMFAAAGFTEVSRPSPRRVVMRREITDR